MTKRNFSTLRLEEAMELVPAQDITRWNLVTMERPPSAVLLEMLTRFESYDIEGSEAGRVLLIDTILSDIVPLYKGLKLWKDEPLEAGDVGGVADYLIGPRRAYLKTPLLCAIEAKRDDFVKGQVQCIAEMAVCQQKNIRDGHNTEVHGIVSNGKVWEFYKLTRTPEVLVSGLFTMNRLAELLGALDHVIAACAANIPQTG
jgi:hypothetical protein